MYRLNIDRLPSSNFAGRVRQIPSRWTHRGVCQDVDILVIMLDGECLFEFTDDNRRIKLYKGEALLIPAKHFYKGSCRVDCEYYFFHMSPSLTPADKNEVSDKIKRRQTSPIPDRTSYYQHEDAVYDCLYFHEVTDITPIMKPLLTLLSKCDIELAKSDVNHMLRFNIYLYQILAQISEEALRGFTLQPVYPASLDRILAYIYEHYTEPITLESLSTRFGLSKQYIIRLFRKNLGVTATRFINDLKLSHAPELLVSSTLNVNEVASHLGFSSASYFSRLFRAKYSVSPTNFI